MRIPTRITTFVFALLLTSTIAYCQFSSNTQITNVDLQYLDNKVAISYTLANGNEKDNYYVWIEVTGENKQKIEAKSLTGSINAVNGNGPKLIVWDLKNDGIVLNENISVQVWAKVIPYVNTGKALALSTLYPGLGDYQYNKNKPHCIKGALAYGCIGTSLYFFGQSASSYNTYKTTPGGDEAAFNDAKTQQTIALTTAGVGAAIWALDYIGIFSKSSNIKKGNTLLKSDPEILMQSPDFEILSNISPAKKINTRGLPPILYAELQFIDGNGNGIIEANEKAELVITLINKGKGDALQVEVTATDSIFDKSMVFEKAKQKFNLIKAGESIDIRIGINAGIDLKNNLHKIKITVDENYGYNMDPVYLMLNSYAYQPAKLAFSGLEILDAGNGTAAIIEDGQLQSNEMAIVKVVIQNVGLDIARNVSYNLSNTNKNIFIENTEGVLGNMKSGELKEIYFNISPNKMVVEKGKLPIFLTMKEDLGKGDLLNYQLPIVLNQKPPEANIVTLKTDEESLKKNVATFEYTSNKFKTNTGNTMNIRSVVPSTTKRPNSVAVIFGVSKYKELPPAPYADNDAKIMKEYFQKVLGIEQVLIYTNDQVSGFIFDDVFNPETGELQRAVIKDSTEVFVYYSGHGIPDKEGKNIYLFPSDGKTSQLDLRGYSVNRLYENLSKLNSKHVTVIMDACFSGASKQTEKIPVENLVAQKGVKIVAVKPWVNDPNFTVFTSSTSEETSLGFDASETGLFTYYFCAGLQGKADENSDKIITVGEMQKYVITNVTETSRRIIGVQTPGFKGDEDAIMVTY